MAKVFLKKAYRTPTGVINGNLDNISEQDLGTIVLKKLVEDRKDGIKNVEEVIIGVARQTSFPSNPARYIALNALVPVEIPAYSVTNQSASGLQAILNGYYLIKSETMPAAIVGGVESGSMVPLEIHNARFDFSMENRDIVEGNIIQQHTSQPQEIYGKLMLSDIEKSLQDYYGLSNDSINEFISNEKDKFKNKKEILDESKSIVQVNKKVKKEILEINDDQLLESNDVFIPYGDCATICLLDNDANDSIGELIGVGISSGNPIVSGSEAIEAVKEAIEKADISLEDIDVITTSYTTPSQGLGVKIELEKLGFDSKIINPIGSVVAYGNAQAAAGVISFIQGIELAKKHSLSICCAEGGQTIATIIKK